MRRILTTIFNGGMFLSYLEFNSCGHYELFYGKNIHHFSSTEERSHMGLEYIGVQQAKVSNN